MTEDRQPKDYFDTPEVDVDFEDAWDPTGYYRRKAEHREEMLPYLGGLFVVLVVIVFVRILIQEKLMIVYTLIFVAGLIVGWNFLAQPAIVKKQIDKIRAKFSRS